MRGAMGEGIDAAELAGGFREVLSREWPIEKAKRHAEREQVIDEALWETLAALGWLGLSIPEAFGGLGLGADGLGLLYRELGACLAPAPVLPTLLAAELVMRAGAPEQHSRWLPAFASGAARGAVCWGPGAQAAWAGGGLRLNGRVADLLDGGAATILFAPVALDGARRWVAVPAGRAELKTIRTIDPSRTLATIEFADVDLPGDCLLGDGEAFGVEDALQAHAARAIAADSIGGGEAILEATVDYLKIRRQFGRPIGSFQALKHRAAEHKAALMVAGAFVDEAAEGADGETALLAALSAKAHASTVYAEVARDAIQLHGGIGYTFEYFAHLYLRRAKMNQALFGTVAQTLDRVADLLV